MNKYLMAALLVCGGQLCAQEPADKKAAAEKRTVTAQAPAPAAQPKKALKAELKPAAAKQEEQEAEESVVLIDSKGEPEAGETQDLSAFGRETEERLAPGGLPSSYGQCKGLMSDAGRNILIFESPDDGALSFVQVTLGKGGVSWKLIDRIPRSAD
ncbi:MAG: hypothetical protein HY550_06395 [Elusimicrobia bacterium]|nr:hypothetical protein [Elusimicrobiota bacterium]